MRIRMAGAAWIEEELGTNRSESISSVNGFVNATVGARAVVTLGGV